MKYLPEPPEKGWQKKCKRGMKITLLFRALSSGLHSVCSPKRIIVIIRTSERPERKNEPKTTSGRKLSAPYTQQAYERAKPTGTCPMMRRKDKKGKDCSSGTNNKTEDKGSTRPKGTYSPFVLRFFLSRQADRNDRQAGQGYVNASRDSACWPPSCAQVPRAGTWTTPTAP